MLILALDTTTRGGSVAVADDDRIVALVAGESTRTHGERLPAEIGRALDRAGVARERIDLLAVACGPGAFTGLRIGLATVQGLAMVLGRPVIGVPTLDALAWAAIEPVEPAEPGEPVEPAHFIIPWMDAQRGDVYAAVYERVAVAGEPLPWRVVEPAVASAPRQLLASWQTELGGRRAMFVGDAVARDHPYLERTGRGLWSLLMPPPLAPAIARLGRRLAEAGRSGPPHALMPIYVRRPDAELARERRDEPSRGPMKDVVVEPLGKPGDLEAVVDIEAASFNNPTTREWYERELVRPEVCFIYVLRTPDDPVAGFCAFWRVGEQIHVNNLAVRPELRGRGLGRQLLDGVLATAARLGATSVTLEVRRSNTPALRLYERAGFRQVGVRRNYYTQPVEDALVLLRP